jgi:uncharacterized protein (TIGR02271 family)
MTDQTTTSPYSGRPVVEWFDEKITLRDVNGDKVGEVVEINPDFLIAESDGGFLGLGERHHYYVPRSYITREETSDWYLSVTKDEAKDLDWRQSPQESSYTGGDWRAEYETTTTDVAAAPERAERTRLVTHQEQLQARPVAQQVGEVGVRKEVVEEVQTLEVPVRREEVVVERRPVSADTVDTGTIGEATETVRVPVMEEQVQVSKTVRPVEEVEVSKRVIEDTETVSDTVRREEVRVDQDPRVRVEDQQTR